jgi:3-oxoacyl-(acyl-carrier-protein) synthase
LAADRQPGGEEDAMVDVVITGLGAASRLGIGVDALSRGMAEVRYAPPEPIADPGAHVPVPLFYRLPDEQLPPGPDEALGLPVGRANLLALDSARQATRSARLVPDPDTRVSVLIGSSVADVHVVERWRTDGYPQRSRWVPVFSAASAIAADLGADGGAVSLSNACSGSGYALAIGADMIAAGETDVVVAGGMETYSRVALACFNRLGALDPNGIRPFDRDRAGSILAEGAGCLVLESAEHAHRRGAPVLARLLGSGWSCDGHHATAPDPTGTQIARAMRAALDDAGATPDDIDFLVPHGTGTERNDATESVAMATVFGDRLAKIPLYSLKALIGHTGGASAALAVAAAVLFCQQGWLPPNVPVAEPDPDCPVLLPADRTPLPGRTGMVNAYAFGGNNMSLIVAGGE